MTVIGATGTAPNEVTGSTAGDPQTSQTAGIVAALTTKHSQAGGIKREMPLVECSPGPKVVVPVTATVTRSVATAGSVGGRMPPKIADFFKRVVVWPTPERPGYVNLHYKNPDHGGMSGRPFNDLSQFLSMIPWCNSHPKFVSDVYFCLSLQQQTGMAKDGRRAVAARHANDAVAFRAIWIDLDGNKPNDPEKGYPTLEAALTAFKKFLKESGLPLPTFFVCSGGGYHIYWVSDKPLTQDEWRPYAHGLWALIQKHGLKADPVTTDAARILRVPDTFNYKSSPPKEVTIEIAQPRDMDFEKTLGWMKSVAPSPRLPHGNSPVILNPDIFKGGPSPALRAAIPQQQDRLGDGIEEPLSLKAICKCPHYKEALLTGGKGHNQGLWMQTVLGATWIENPREVAHALSEKHPGYTTEGCDAMFDRKMADRQNMGLGWPSCETFKNYGCKLCSQCSHFAKGKSPLHLGRPRVPLAQQNGANQWKRQLPVAVSLVDFHAYMPMHNYIFAPSREPWPASSVDARLGTIPVFGVDGKPLLDGKGKQKRLAASAWLDRERPVEQMTWAPGLPMVIRDRLISEGGWIERHQVSCFNLYRPPIIEPGNACEADRWLDHVHKIFGGDADHIVKWLAQRVQRPQEKINHALVFGGLQGIGKDTLLEPVKHAVGPWNFFEVSPQQMLGRFNGFLKSVILRVNEARDLGETNRFSFYDHMKAYTAAPPDVLRVDEKNLREHSILNCCGVIITTNHKADGIYLPADDRRHFVAWSDLKKEDFAADYWKSLWGWYARDGYRHVAAYLAQLDISSFDPKAPPPKTPAFWDIVDANRAPEDAELADVLDQMKNPNATTLISITNHATGAFQEWITDRKNRRAIPHRLEKCGYVPVRNDAAKDGLWVIDGSRQVIYAKSELSFPDRFKAASDLAQPTKAKQTKARKAGEVAEVSEVGEVSENPTSVLSTPTFK